MIDLARSIDDVLEIDGRCFRLNLAFDTVLRLFEMVHDEEIPLFAQPHLALRILIKSEGVEEKQRLEEFLGSLSIESAFEVYKAIFDEHIVIKNTKEQAPMYDLAGNLVEKRIRSRSIEEEEEENPLFSLKYDGDYIYSSFLQAYQIDLIEMQGVLHWQKFFALLNGLPSDTKFAEVLRIRSWEEQKGDSPEYKEKMRRLQDEYALPEYFEY
ncbi:TPA: Gp15 family bacteriophage protein [Streptococcus suis]